MNLEQARLSALEARVTALEQDRPLFGVTPQLCWKTKSQVTIKEGAVFLVAYRNDLGNWFVEFYKVKQIDLNLEDGSWTWENTEFLIPYEDLRGALPCEQQ